MTAWTDPHGARAERRVAHVAHVAGGTPRPDAARIGVVAVVTPSAGKLSRRDRKVLGLARRLADRSEAGVLAVADAALDESPGAAGADRILVVDGQDPGADLDAALARVVSRFEPAHVVLADAQRPATLGRRLAARLRCRPNTGVWSVHEEVARCGAAPRGFYEMALSRVVLVADGGEAPYGGAARECTPVPADGTDARGPVPVREWRVSRDDIELTQAELVLGGGRGVTDWVLLHEAAAALGASVAASRPIVDRGSLPRSRQVGASGVAISARCYLACGISGAPQHLEGIKDCDLVIAVNTDPNSPMARRADVFLQADAQAVLRALLERVRGPAR